MPNVSFELKSSQIDSIVAKKSDDATELVDPQIFLGKDYYIKYVQPPTPLNETVTFSFPEINGEFSLGNFKNDFLEKFYQDGGAEDNLFPKKIKIVSVLHKPSKTLTPLLYNDSFDSNILQKFGDSTVIGIKELLSKGILPKYSNDETSLYELCSKDYSMWRSSSGDNSKCYYPIEIQYAFDYSYKLTGRVLKHKYTPGVGFNQDVDKTEDFQDRYVLNRSGTFSINQSYTIIAPKEGSAWVNPRFGSDGFWRGKLQILFDGINLYLLLDTSNGFNDNKLSDISTNAKILIPNRRDPRRPFVFYVHSKVDDNRYYLSEKRVVIDPLDPDKSKIYNSNLIDLTKYIKDITSNFDLENRQGTLPKFSIKYDPSHTYKYSPDIDDFIIEKQPVKLKPQNSITKQQFINSVVHNLKNSIQADIDNFLNFGPSEISDKPIQKKQTTFEKLNVKVQKTDNGCSEFTYEVRQISMNIHIEPNLGKEVYIKKIILSNAKGIADLKSEELIFMCETIDPISPSVPLEDQDSWIKL